MKLKLIYSEEAVAENREDSSDHADDEGSPRLDHHVSGGTDGHTTGQSRVLDVDHVELVLFTNQGRDGERSDATGGQRVVGVHNGTMLSISFGQTRVETRPKQPQKDGTYNKY